MRLAKKAVAVALAAVMAVSMLTACSGGGGGGSPNNNTPSGGNTGTVTPGGGSGSGDSGNTPGGGSTDKPGTDNPGGSGDGEDSETVSYLKSRTGAFYKRFAPGKYTIGSKKVNAIGSDLPEITLVSTDGNRTYVEIFDEADQNNYQTSVIGLEDKKQKKSYALFPDSRDNGKKGFYIEEDAEIDDSKNDEISETKPTENGEFTVEKKNTYYIESQIVGKYKKSYWYDGNSSTPKYVIFSEVKSDGQEKEYYRVEFFRVEDKADSSLLDFESILKDYDNVTDDPNYNPGSVKTFQTKFSFKRPVM